MQFLLHSFVGLFLDQIGMFLLNPFPSIPPTTQPVDKTESVAPDFRPDRVSRDPDLVGFFCCLFACSKCVQLFRTHTHQGYEHRHPSLGLPSGGECTGVLGPRRSPATTKTTLEKLMIVYDQGSFFAQEFEVSC